MKCRHCETELKHVFVDLAYSPVSNAMLSQNQLMEPELYFPLKIYTCHNCWLVQVDEMQKADKIFDEQYTYFSSFSSSWLQHARNYVNMMCDRFSFDENSLVLEIASNDGYLLQYFKEKGIPVLGVDPTANTAEEATKKGIETIVDFFYADFARNQIEDKNRKADLIIGNNVLAHVPDINDFVKGMKIALNPQGIITMEFPHLLQLINEFQFDTIYHEHFSYLSFYAVKQIFEKQGLEMFDVEEIPTHGGSLRIYAKHKGDTSKKIGKRVEDLLNKEVDAKINSLELYEGFQQKVENVKYGALSFLIDQKKAGNKIIGYGAAAKGNTFLNYCGIKGTDIIEFVVDASPYKQNKFLPGSHIPVVDISKIKEYKPDYIIILPWNLKNEIAEQLKFVREWGAKFVIFIPETTVF
ncbi:MAG: class I SAM-dependent methyltransferase [Bacteroidales bacterium]|nr:class I SAM-dependent methyltransferase [Bacteroidales bacterium]MCF8405342.1 class I SAM-dependent methyltransferase [Bacteroidales bacterium]